MKKLIAIVLALVLLCAATACTGGDPALDAYCGKYLCYQISLGGEISAADGEWIVLDQGGKGRLGISQEVDMEWEINGKSLTIKALGGPYMGKLTEDGDIMLDWGGTIMYFSRSAKAPATESQLIPYTEPTETEAPTELPTEVDYSAAYVTDAVTKMFTFEEMEMEYHVPKIVFDGEGIDYLNDMMYQQIYDNVYVTEVEDSLDAYGMPGVCYIVYQWGVSDSFLSIVVTITPYLSEGAEFQIYNVDLSNGQLASQSELLTHFGYTPDSFEARAKDVMGSVVADQYASLFDDPSLKTELDDLMKRSTSAEYVADATPFVGADGKLWMVAPIASIAGADRYMQVIQFTDYPISDAYLNYSYG